MRRALLAVLCVFMVMGSARPADAPANLLRNADFQDDWLTLLPQLKNHHWCYVSEFYNRRDYNPDGWSCQGSWEWHDADAPAGGRHLMLRAPAAELVQRVNAWAVHDDRSTTGFPDAGGFPVMQPLRSRRPLSLVRDLTFRVRITGHALPEKAGTIEVGWCPAGGSDSNPYGAAAPLVLATTALPAGTYDAKWVDAKLPAAQWRKAAEAASAKDPKEAAATAKGGILLPGIIQVAIHLKSSTGDVEVHHAELTESAPASPNLLTNGGFEQVDGKGYPSAWKPPSKYLYFPPGHYYIFNTWHNTRFENRGPVGADSLIVHTGKHSLRMIVPAGDEKAVTSRAVALKQTEPRLIEVQAFVKTDRLAMLQIDAVDETGQRLDAFAFINKAPLSIGTDDWRVIRQVFRPRKPVQTLRLQLCARGVNGYTLNDTGLQPQNNVCGTVWWDDVRLSEPESTADELSARGVKPAAVGPAIAAVHIENVRLGEELIGPNALTATIGNPTTTAGTFRLEWDFTLQDGKHRTYAAKPVTVSPGGRQAVELPYEVGIDPAAFAAYREQRGELRLRDGNGSVQAKSDLWIGHWTSALDLHLGALYLRPEQKQLVRVNLGLSQRRLADLTSIRIEVLRRGNGATIKQWIIPATAQSIALQRNKLPQELRGDFTNLFLTDLDVGFLPLQPFDAPQRNWRIRVCALDRKGEKLAETTSAPFCRLDHEPRQAAVASVRIRGDLLYVNDKPWMPFGVCYGHVPVFDGPADTGKYRDLHNLPVWSIYDRFSAATYTRSANDFNCLRYVAGSITNLDNVEKLWKEQNLLCASAFVIPDPAFSVAELVKKAGGQDKLEAYLARCKSSPAVIAVAPGIEEAFGLFHKATPEQLKGLQAVADRLRQATGKPVMVGHGGYSNRFEFEKVPFFDIYDPETEPFYPANLHSDLAPLLKGKDRVIWLRPQMYEDVPYERWRFHALVELMRGCRGWQIAHGPGDASLFRGLHAELKSLEPYVYSRESVPAITAAPAIEHWSRQHQGKLVIIAATTHGIALGRWRWDPSQKPEGFARSRCTDQAGELRSEDNGYSMDRPPYAGPSVQGIHSLPDARTWPAGTKLVQWVRLDPEAKPRNLVLLAQADGRWLHAISWGDFQVARLRQDPQLASWFLRTFYRHSSGFLGWDNSLLKHSLQYIPERTSPGGELPAAGQWLKLEVPLEKIGAADKVLEGVAGLHEGGRVWWGPSLLVSADGKEHVVFGDSLQRPAQLLAKTKFAVPGLKAGAKVQVLFEDRELTAEDGCFVDDLRGEDLYQRFGGGLGVGYGDEPVAVRVYQLDGR